MTYPTAVTAHATETPPVVEIALPTILVINDDKGVLATIGKILKGYGFQVVKARNGRQVMIAFRNAVPDVVVTDVITPEMDGIEAIAEIRRASPSAKIIAMSNGGRNGITDFATLAIKLGADVGLRKPVNPDQLLDAIAALLSFECKRVLATVAA